VDDDDLKQECAVCKKNYILFQDDDGLWLCEDCFDDDFKQECDVCREKHLLFEDKGLLVCDDCFDRMNGEV
jgi:ribosomal protein L37AE/L43A